MIKQTTKMPELKENFSLKNCTSFGIGGPAKYFAIPETIDELFNLVEEASALNLKYKIIGNGTNILFGDNGFNGLVVSTKKISSAIVLEDNVILASAGASLASIISLAKENSLTGLEFAVGIPGSVGGAIVMNAGAGGSEISKVIKSVTLLENGEIRYVTPIELNFSYRSSYFFSHADAIILFAELELQKGEKSEIESKMKTYLNRRLLTQPRERSAGCVFKKCGDTPAGLLIDQAGLKNLKMGDARVSDVHANFIVNDGNATANDVKKLIKEVQLRIWKKYKKNLELEIEIIE